MSKSCLPSLSEANRLLKEAEALNPGPWVQHSLYTGQAAGLIAGNCRHLDPEKAYILGMLHDIGRRFGVKDMRHSLDGFTYSMHGDYESLAKVCITHSFPTGNIRDAFGQWGCSPEEYHFVENYLQSAAFDDYDRLIQLCDAIALPSGFVLMEKRMVDVAVRHGIHEFIIPKWKATFQIKQYFENQMGRSIYAILPGVVENTFEI
jgi:hypothetical protein